MILPNSVYCGCCLSLMKKMENNSVNLILTSPPYNMRTRISKGKYITREKTDHFSKKYAYFHDALPIDDYYIFHKKCLNEMLRISPIVFWNISIVTGSKEAVFRLIGDFHKHIKDIVIWDKGHGQPAMHPAILNRASELILILENPPTTGRAFSSSFFGRGTMDDIWRIKRAKAIKNHGACFPEGLAERVILNWSKEGDLVLDPFTGSGTTLKVAKENNRRYIGMELIPEYYNIIKERLSGT